MYIQVIIPKIFKLIIDPDKLKTFKVSSLFYILVSGLLFINHPAFSFFHSQNKTHQSLSDTVKIIRGPYLQMGTTSSIIIRWRTNIPTDSRILYGKSSKNLNQTAEDKKNTTEHILQLSELEQYTKYYYSVGNSEKIIHGNDSSYYFITAPEDTGDKTVRIWVIGDFGTADSIPKAVKNAYLHNKKNKHTDAWLMLGDIAYTRGTDEQYQKALFDNMYDELLSNTVIWPTPGNHDCRTADSETQSGPYYDIFSLPTRGEAGGIPSETEAYYSFDYGNIHFISLDTEDTPLDSDGDMLSWLESNLKANKSRWTIVFFHHPPYTKGTHNSDKHWDSGGRMTHVRENILPILDKYGVDLVMSGHSHVYERSYLIANHYGHAKTFKAKTMTINSEGKKKRHPSSYIKTENGPGTIYVVCGVSGNRPRAGHFGHPAMAYCSDKYHGSLSIEIKNDQLYAIFLDDRGKVRDWFRIDKKEKTIAEIPALGGDN